MAVQDYYYKKFLSWQQQGKGDYSTFLRSLGATQFERRRELALEFRNDKDNGFSEVCQYLLQYAKGKEQESITSFIQSITNPEKDIMELLIGATLDACGYTDTGNSLIGWAIIGLIGVALLALLGTLGKNK